MSEPAWRTRPAPGGLAAVQEFVNTHAYSGRADGLDDPAAAAVVTGLPVELLDDGARAGLRALREALRTVLLGHADLGGLSGDDADDLDACLADVRLGVGVDGEGRVVPVGCGDGVAGFVGDLVARAVMASADGTWIRLKVCRNDVCRVAFYDDSRSRTGRYCSARGCANRARQRAFRARHSSSTSAGTDGGRTDGGGGRRGRSATRRSTP
jgi:predicted RNA-binding Zn ribbon-like protein